MGPGRPLCRRGRSAAGHGWGRPARLGRGGVGGVLLRALRGLLSLGGPRGGGAGIRGAPGAALMTVYRNDGRFDRSNAVFSESMVTRYDKRATLPPPDMRFIDYGLSVLRRQVVDQRIPAGTVLDLADVYSRLSADRLLAGYEVKERFYEVGSVQGRADLEALLSAPDEPVG